MTNIQIKHHDGNSWISLFPKTKASITELDNGTTVESTISSILTDISNAVTIRDVEREIQKIVGAAPEALDTLIEISEALNNDPDFASTVMNQLSSKVDKVSGKELSANDFTNALKTKLDGIASNANNYTHPATHPASIIVETDDKQFVTKTDKSKWDTAADEGLKLGTTSTSAHRGDHGKIAYDHSQVPHAPSNAQKNSDITKSEIESKLTGNITSHTHLVTQSQVGLGNVNNTSDADKPISTATQAALDRKSSVVLSSTEPSTNVDFWFEEI